MKSPAKITTLQELVALPLQMHSKDEFGQLCWWRGHSDESWTLAPSVYRNQKGERYEAAILRWFIARANIGHEKDPRRNDNFGWLSLAQHYRLPTRLLDWTQSVLVAAYFAVNENKDKDAALWCLQPGTFNYHHIGKEGLTDSLTEEVVVSSAVAFINRMSDLTEEDQVYIRERKYVAVVPEISDLRMLQQMAMFTIHNTPSPIDSNTDSDVFLRKFIIPKEHKHILKLALESLGINTMNLFPDLESIGKCLADYDFSYLDE